jgi:hypothetical protein
MRLLIKRDISSNGFPSPEQLEVGELVMNSKTGKLYSKLIDGSIIEWIGQKICFEPMPVIAFSYKNQAVSNIENFCCAGDLLSAVVTNLKSGAVEYSYAFVELTQNSTTNLVSIGQPKYENYQETQNDNTITLRKATIPLNISVNPETYNNISIFKFSVLDSNNSVLTEQILTFKCIEASL